MNHEFNNREKHASQFAYEVRAFPRDGVAELPRVSQFINWDSEIPTTPELDPHHVKKLRLKVFLGGMVR